MALFVAVAELADAPDCDSGPCGFKSHRSPQLMRPCRLTARTAPFQSSILEGNKGILRRPGLKRLIDITSAYVISFSCTAGDLLCRRLLCATFRLRPTGHCVSGRGSTDEAPKQKFARSSMGP